MGKHLVSSGEEFLVDDIFDQMIVECRWQLLRDKTGRLTHYIRGKENRSKKTYLLHRVLMGANPGEQVDHINRNGLDNRLCNLRIVTHAQNQHNRKARHDAETGCKGVRYWDGPEYINRWQVRLSVKGKRTSLGFYKTKEEAVAVYNAKVKEVHGNFAYLNEIS